jgi:mRNA interferase MazF
MAGVYRMSEVFSRREGVNRKIRRGDVFYADLTPSVGSEQDGTRPVLIIQNNAGNKHSKTVIAAVITGKIQNKAKLPTHYPIKAQQGLARDSLVLLEQIRTIDRVQLKEYIGTLDAEAMTGIDRALAVSVGLRGRKSYDD